MRSNRLVVVAVALACVCLVTTPVVASAQSAGMGQIAGSWTWSTNLGPLGSVPSLATFDKDGTVIVTEGFTFGNPLAPTPEQQGMKSGTGHGTWVRTGPKTFAATGISMLFDSTGTIVGFSRARLTAVLVDPDHLEAVGTREILLGCVVSLPAGGMLPRLDCPDPADPAAAWVPHPSMPPGGFHHVATRISAGS